MDDKKYNSFIGKFKAIFAPSLPALYGQGLTDYEILVRILGAVNECVDKINSFNEIAAKMDEVLTDLDGYIKDEVKAILQEMYDTGELKEILAEIAENYFTEATAPKFTNVDGARLFRIARKAHEFSGVDLTTEAPHYSFCQGGCVFVREGVTYFAGCFVPGANDSRSYYQDDCDVRIYRKYSEGWYFVKNAVKNVFHGNSIAYDEINDRFYIAPSIQYINRVASPMNTVFALDWDLNFIGGTGGYSFAQMNKISNVACYGGDVFISSDGLTGDIYKVTSFDNLTLEKEVELDFTDERYSELSKTFGLYGVGLACNDLYFFVGAANPAAILRVNRTTGAVDWVYNLGEFGNNHMFRLGELENISIIDNTIYYGCSIQNHNTVHFIDFLQLFAFDYVNNSLIPNIALSKQSNSNYFNLNVGDAASDVSVRAERFEICNPNGDANNWFPTLSEALIFADSQDVYDSLRITCKTRNLLEPVCIGTSKNIIIDGSDYFTAHQNDEDINTRYPHINMLYIYGGNVTLNNMQVENRTYSGGNISAGLVRYQMTVRNCNFAIRGGRVHITGRATNDVIQAIDAFINWANNIYINSVAGTLAAADSAFTNCIVNSHGAYDGTNNNVLG